MRNNAPLNPASQAMSGQEDVPDWLCRVRMGRLDKIGSNH